MANKETLVVISKAKAYIKEKGCMSSSEVVDALNNKIYELIDNAVVRAKENKRSTVRPYDF